MTILSGQDPGFCSVHRRSLLGKGESRQAILRLNCIYKWWRRCY